MGDSLAKRDFEQKNKEWTSKGTSKASVARAVHEPTDKKQSVCVCSNEKPQQL